MKLSTENRDRKAGVSSSTENKDRKADVRSWSSSDTTTTNYHRSSTNVINTTLSSRTSTHNHIYNHTHHNNYIHHTKAMPATITTTSAPNIGVFRRWLDRSLQQNANDSSVDLYGKKLFPRMKGSCNGKK